MSCVRHRGFRDRASGAFPSAVWRAANSPTEAAVRTPERGLATRRRPTRPSLRSGATRFRRGDSHVWTARIPASTHVNSVCPQAWINLGIPSESRSARSRWAVERGAGRKVSEASAMLRSAAWPAVRTDPVWAGAVRGARSGPAPACGRSRGYLCRRRGSGFTGCPPRWSGSPQERNCTVPLVTETQALVVYRRGDHKV